MPVLSQASVKRLCFVSCGCRHTAPGDSISEFFSSYSALAADFPGQPPSPHSFDVVAFEISEAAARRIAGAAQAAAFNGSLTVHRAAAAHFDGQSCLM
jgi:hypothetical protein